MRFLWELKSDLCGTPVRNIVNVAFFHFVIHGIFVTAFVFSNTAYPLYYYVDYMFGISGATLIFVAIVGAVIAALRNYQALRSSWALIVVLNVFTVIVTAIYYTVARWDDVITTAFTRAIRRPSERDFVDYFWCTLAVIACLMTIPFLFYLIYITSYMCNKWKSYLFTYNYEPATQAYPYYPGYYATTITVPQVPQSQAYPTQQSK